MGVKIPVDPTVGSAQGGDTFPARRTNASITLSVELVKEYIENEGIFLKGDPSAVYVEDQNTLAKWQLGQKNAALTLDAGGSPATITPDCAQNDTFYIAPSSTELELQTPTNMPSAAQLGGGAASGFHWVVYARNGTGGSAGFVSFSSDFSELPGSKPYLRSGDNRLNIIHCYYQAGEYYYKIDNVGYAEGQLVDFDITITSAQVLASYTTPVEIIAAAGSGFFIDIQNICAALVGGSTPYASNTDAKVYMANGFIGLVDIDLTNDNLNRGPEIGELGTTLDSLDNDPVLFTTLSGDPTAGDYDIRIWGTYLVRAI